MKVAFWDLECSGLNATFGVMICAGIKPIGKPPIMISEGRKGASDQQLCVNIRDELEKYDILISWYGLDYDLKMLNSRLLKWREKRLRFMLHQDDYRIAKRYLNTHSRRLDVVATHLGVKHEKTKIIPDDWVTATIDGNKKALKSIVRHCELDCYVLEEVHERLAPYIRSISGT